MRDSSRPTLSTSSRTQRQQRAGFIEWIASWPSIGPLPDLRNALLARTVGECGDDLEAESGVIFEFPERIRIGARVFINRGTVVTARAPIYIGDDSLIGPYVIINSGNHLATRLDIPINRQGHTEAPIHIGSNVWLGAHVCVLQGVTIGDGAVIGAGAVVAGDIPERAIAVGVPARVIRIRGLSQ